MDREYFLCLDNRPLAQLKDCDMTDEELLVEQMSFYDELRHLMESTSNENCKFLEHYELLQFTGMYEPDHCKTLLDCNWPGWFYNDSCVLTNFSELVMLFEIATINHFPFQNAFLWMLVNFEAPDDFTIFFNHFFQFFFFFKFFQKFSAVSYKTVSYNRILRVKKALYIIVESGTLSHPDAGTP